MGPLNKVVRGLLGFMVLLTLGLVILGSQIEPEFAKAQEKAAISASAQDDANFLPSAGGIDAEKMARYERKKSEEKGFGGRMMGLFGILGFIAIAWLMSNNRKAISWRLVASGIGMQLVFAVFILWTPIGKSLFGLLNDVVTRLLDFTTEGSAFLFGFLIAPGNFTIAFNVLPTIIFFSSLMTVLYYLGLMQLIVRVMSTVMQRLMGTSGAETLSATANIFVGQTEAPLVIKPYVSSMTKSELMVVMTGGFATVAGGVLAAYVGLLRSDFPDIAGHLIAASVMSAPAALVIAKIIIPETEVPVTMGDGKLDEGEESEDANAIDAAARGAGEGLKLALNVGAMLLAFIALVAMLNFLIGLPSYLKNQSQFSSVHNYVQSSALPIPEGCKDPKNAGDISNCIHANEMMLFKAAYQPGMLDKPVQNLQTCSTENPSTDAEMLDCLPKEILAEKVEDNDLKALGLMKEEELAKLRASIVEKKSSGRLIRLDQLSNKGYEAANNQEKIELFGAVIGASLKDRTPLKGSRVLDSCKNEHRIAACGAIATVTQSDEWVDSYETPDLWPTITIESLMGWLFFPLAFLMGVPWAECQLVGQLLGQKMVLNEFLAYINLKTMMNDGLLSYRSIVISTYALCGFANFGSIAIQIGGIGGIAPERRGDLAKLGVRAMIGGSLAAFMTATIAGALIM